MKRYISLLMISFLVFFLMASVSCDRTETPVTPVNQETTDAELQAKLAEMEKYNQEFFALVDRIEPYVTTNNDQTWSVDWEGFTAANPNLTADEAKLVEELRQGVLLANAAILEAFKVPGEKQSVWTSYYWWGRRTCFTGNDALDYAHWFSTLSYVGFYFGFPGAVLKAYAEICKWLANGCGGFCLVSSWFGGLWITCP